MHEYHARRFALGREDALAYFYNLLFAGMVHFGVQITKNRQESEDIASFAFAKTWQHRENLDSFGAIRAYLFQIVRRDSHLYVRTQAKRKKREQAVKVEESENVLFERLLRTETYRLLHEEIQKMPDGCREVMDRYYLKGLNTREIALSLGVGISTVATQKLRGVAKLRKLFSGLQHTWIIAFAIVFIFSK